VGSADLLPPSPPGEKATARQDQAGKSSTGDGAGDEARSSSIADLDARSLGRTRCKVQVVLRIHYNARADRLIPGLTGVKAGFVNVPKGRGVPSRLSVIVTVLPEDTPLDGNAASATQHSQVSAERRRAKAIRQSQRHPIGGLAVGPIGVASTLNCTPDRRQKRV